MNIFIRLVVTGAGTLFLSKGAMQKFKVRAFTQEQGCRLVFGFGGFACARDVTASRTSSILTSRNNMALASFRMQSICLCMGR